MSRLLESVRASRTARAVPWQPAGTLVLTILAIVWCSTSGYRQDLGILTTTYALVALGMYVPFILGSRLSLAYNAYLGIGAYSVGIVGTKSDLPLLTAVPIAMVLSAVVALILGFATRQLSGFYLAAVTLLFGIAFESWLGEATSITGGPAGLGGIPAISFAGDPVGRTAMVAVAFLVVWACVQSLRSLRASLFGVTVRAVREAPEAVEALGARVPHVTLATLAVGAAITSLGGVIFALFNRSVLPETFTITIVFFALFMPILGGRISPWGAVIGAILVTYFTFGLKVIEGAGLLVFALAVLAVLLIAPQGLLGVLGSAASRARDWKGWRR